MQTPDYTSSPNRPYNARYVWTVCVVAAMGGLLFGYDWVVIGGAKPFFEPFLRLVTDHQKGWANSSALIGCLLGAIVSGGLSDRFGRKRLLIAAAFVFVVSSVGTGMAGSLTTFVCWRLLGGTAIGLASSMSPLYIAELAPAAIRGRLVSLNQLTIVIGILAAQIANWLIARPVPGFVEALSDLDKAEFIRQSWNGQVGWRWMFGVTTIPSLLFFVSAFLIPESPRWLVKNGKSARARGILERVGGPAYAGTALADIEQTLVNDIEKVDFRRLIEPRMLPILCVGVVLAILQQWCGINVIFNYAQEVFAAAGYGVSQVLLNIVITGTVNMATTFIALYTVDRLGRRILMLAGAAGLAIIYTLMGICFHSHSQGVHVLALVVAAIGCYGCTLAPVTWVVLAEIFPNRIRGAAMSVSVFALWLACFILTYTFPFLNSGLGTAGTFWMYAVICVGIFLFVRACLPETKGKTLEQIERDLVD